jgi:diadenylate cyclase
MVICVSQRRDEIALFYKNIKYVIRDTGEIIRRATSVLQILEKHRDIFDRSRNELDDEELRKNPSLIKAFSLIQRGTIMLKLSETLKGYVIELGVEGTIVKTRLKELLHRIEKEVDEVIKDYSKLGFSKSKKILSVLSYDELLELENIKQCLGLSDNSEVLGPKGHRILEKRGIPEKDIGILIKNLKNLASILELKKETADVLLGKEKSDNIYEKIIHKKE